MLQRFHACSAAPCILLEQQRHTCVDAIVVLQEAASPPTPAPSVPLVPFRPIRAQRSVCLVGLATRALKVLRMKTSATQSMCALQAQVSHRDWLTDTLPSPPSCMHVLALCLALLSGRMSKQQLENAEQCMCWLCGCSGLLCMPVNLKDVPKSEAAKMPNPHGAVDRAALQHCVTLLDGLYYIQPLQLRLPCTLAPFD